MTTLKNRPNTALLVIDVQNGVVAGTPKRDAVVANVGSLVEKARRERVPVVWVQHSDEGLARGSDRWKIVAELALAATAFGFTQLIGVVGAPTGGWLSDRLGRRMPILMSLGVIGPAVYLLTLVPNELLVVPLAIFGLAFSMRSTATEVLVMDTAPAERRGAVLGAYYLAAQPIGGIATPIFGAIAGVVGIAPAFSGVGLLLVAMSVVAVLAGRGLSQD